MRPGAVSPQTSKGQRGRLPGAPSVPSVNPGTTEALGSFILTAAQSARNQYRAHFTDVETEARLLKLENGKWWRQDLTSGHNQAVFSGLEDVQRI